MGKALEPDDLVTYPRNGVWIATTSVQCRVFTRPWLTPFRCPEHSQVVNVSAPTKRKRMSLFFFPSPSIYTVCKKLSGSLSVKVRETLRCCITSSMHPLRCTTVHAFIVIVIAKEGVWHCIASSTRVNLCTHTREPLSVACQALHRKKRSRGLARSRQNRS